MLYVALITQCNIQHVNNLFPHLASCSFAWHHYFLYPQCFHHMLEGFRKQKQEMTLKHDHKWLHYAQVYIPRELLPCHHKSYKEGSEIFRSAFKSLRTFAVVSSLDGLCFQDLLTPLHSRSETCPETEWWLLCQHSLKTTSPSLPVLSRSPSSSGWQESRPADGIAEDNHR